MPHHRAEEGTKEGTKVEERVNSDCTEKGQVGGKNGREEGGGFNFVHASTAPAAAATAAAAAATKKSFVEKEASCSLLLFLLLLLPYFPHRPL